MEEGGEEERDEGRVEGKEKGYGGKNERAVGGATREISGCAIDWRDGDANVDVDVS